MFRSSWLWSAPRASLPQRGKACQKWFTEFFSQGGTLGGPRRTMENVSSETPRVAWNGHRWFWVVLISLMSNGVSYPSVLSHQMRSGFFFSLSLGHDWNWNLGILSTLWALQIRLGKGKAAKGPHYYLATWNSSYVGPLRAHVETLVGYREGCSWERSPCTSHLSWPSSVPISERAILVCKPTLCSALGRTPVYFGCLFPLLSLAIWVCASAGNLSPFI